jgi:hypothetical protein
MKVESFLPLAVAVSGDFPGGLPGSIFVLFLS